MHSFADSFEQPVNIQIDGKQVTVPLLSQRDYLSWIEEVTQKRRENAIKSAPPAGKVMERARWMDYAENLEVTPGDLQPYVFRAHGTIKVLELALKKAKVDEAAIGKFIDGQPAKANEMLAVRVSGLFRREEIEQLYPMFERPKDPNVQAPTGEQNPSVGERTGPSGDSASNLEAVLTS